ncbi:MAG TPA: STAS domain-containing protein [Gemmataceae bacterium]|nr:STAS domain-containing protein [Gemmataceae bacterium]
MVELPPYYGWLEVEEVGGVTVMRLSARTILGAEAVGAIGEQLQLLAEGSGSRHFVLSLARVESVTTDMVGTFVALHRRVQADGGRLVLCGVGDFLGQILGVLKLTEVFPVYADEAEALRSF